MKRLLAILTALLLALSLSVGTFASGEASGDASGTTVEDTGPKAAIVLGDEGEDTENEQTEDYDLTFFAGGAKTDAGIYGFTFASDSSEAAFLYSEPTENELSYAIGGDAANIALDEYPASETAIDFLKGVGVESFDSAIILGDDADASSCKPVISAKGWTDLDITNTLVLAAGAPRSAFYSDVSGGSTVPGPGAMGGAQGSEAPVVVVSNSLLETTGGGDIAGEIRLGYLHQNGEVKIVSGGSVTGQMPEAIPSMEFSSETEQYDTFVIPRVTLLKGLKITGVA